MGLRHGWIALGHFDGWFKMTILYGRFRPGCLGSKRSDGLDTAPEAGLATSDSLDSNRRCIANEGGRDIALLSSRGILDINRSDVDTDHVLSAVPAQDPSFGETVVRLEQRDEFWVPAESAT
jgi:hypothetical protein